MDSPFRGPVNLGNPEEYTVLELAQLVQSILESDAGIEFRDLPVHDPRLRKPDIELARVELGWQPRISLPEGLRKTIEHLRIELAEQDQALSGAPVRD
jgi:UDP-glucuronate decarboxylase